MKKIGLLVGTYIVASLIGSSIGMILWINPHSVRNFIGVLVIPVVFQLLALLDLLGTNLVLGIIGCCLVILTVIGSVIAFWRTERKWILLILSIPFFICSLYTVRVFDILASR